MRQFAGADHASDSHNLRRFVEVQAPDYDMALAEISAGQKRGHWMWYIFPQYDGLGRSSIARRFAIKSIAEATAYLRHDVLGPRLVECTEVLLRVEGRTVHQIFGADDVKLRSCATLFAYVSPAGSTFHRLLDRFFAGEPDSATLSLIGRGIPTDSPAGGSRGPT